MIDTAGEIAILVAAIKEWGSLKEGKHAVEYGILFDKTANTLEALNGTLRSARRQKIVRYPLEIDDPHR